MKSAVLMPLSMFAFGCHSDLAVSLSDIEQKSTGCCSQPMSAVQSQAIRLRQPNPQGAKANKKLPKLRISTVGPGSMPTLETFASSMDLIAIGRCGRVLRRAFSPMNVPGSMQHTVFEFTVVSMLKGDPGRSTFLLRQNTGDLEFYYDGVLMGGTRNDQEPLVRVGKTYLIFADRLGDKGEPDGAPLYSRRGAESGVSGFTGEHLLKDGYHCVLELEGGRLKGIMHDSGERAVPKVFEDIRRSLVGMTEAEAKMAIINAMRDHDDWLNEAKDRIRRQGGG